MSISPISFKRAIKVHAPYAVANNIAKIANGEKTSSDENLNKFVKDIFYDTNRYPAKVHSIGKEGVYTPDTIFIFSGLEGLAADKISKEADRQIRDHEFENENIESVSQATEIISKKIWAERNEQLANLSENGTCDKKASILKVSAKGEDIKEMLYSSAQGDNFEHIEYKA